MKRDSKEQANARYRQTLLAGSARIVGHANRNLRRMSDGEYQAAQEVNHLITQHMQRPESKASTFLQKLNDLMSHFDALSPGKGPLGELVSELHQHLTTAARLEPLIRVKATPIVDAQPQFNQPRPRVQAQPAMPTQPQMQSHQQAYARPMAQRSMQPAARVHYATRYRKGDDFMRTLAKASGGTDHYWRERSKGQAYLHTNDTQKADSFGQFRAHSKTAKLKAAVALNRLVNRFHADRNTDAQYFVRSLKVLKRNHPALKNGRLGQEFNSLYKQASKIASAQQLQAHPPKQKKVKKKQVAKKTVKSHKQVPKKAAPAKIAAVQRKPDNGSSHKKSDRPKYSPEQEKVIREVRHVINGHKRKANGKPGLLLKQLLQLKKRHPVLSEGRLGQQFDKHVQAARKSATKDAKAAPRKDKADKPVAAGQPVQVSGYTKILQQATEKMVRAGASVKSFSIQGGKFTISAESKAAEAVQTALFDHRQKDLKGNEGSSKEALLQDLSRVARQHKVLRGKGKVGETFKKICDDIRNYSPDNDNSKGSGKGGNGGTPSWTAKAASAQKVNPADTKAAAAVRNRAATKTAIRTLAA